MHVCYWELSVPDKREPLVANGKHALSMQEVFSLVPNLTHNNLVHQRGVALDIMASVIPMKIMHHFVVWQLLSSLSRIAASPSCFFLVVCFLNSNCPTSYCCGFFQKRVRYEFILSKLKYIYIYWQEKFCPIIKTNEEIFKKKIVLTTNKILIKTILNLFFFLLKEGIENENKQITN